jgi:hypothetical protein
MIEEMIGLFLIGITVGAFVSWWITYSYMKSDWELGKKSNTAADWEHNTTVPSVASLLDENANWSAFFDNEDIEIPKGLKERILSNIDKQIKEEEETCH